jgi:D-glycero-alpha-D-manno-heptose 1-phosphate guanylyltransferase
MNCDVVILCGGLGTRIKKVVTDVPKVLAPINNIPFIKILLQQLEKKIEGKVILALGYKSEMVQKYCCGLPLKNNISYSVENKPLGTGGALKKAITLSLTPDVLVLNGDTYIDMEFDRLIHHHRQLQSDITMACVDMPDASRYGAVTTDKHTNKVISFKEKTTVAQAGNINAGAYVINKKILNDLPDNTFISLEKEVLPQYVGKEFYSYLSSGKFIDIGTEQSYNAAQEFFNSKEI